MNYYFDYSYYLDQHLDYSYSFVIVVVMVIYLLVPPVVELALDHCYYWAGWNWPWLLFWGWAWLFCAAGAWLLFYDWWTCCGKLSLTIGGPPGPIKLTFIGGSFGICKLYCNTVLPHCKLNVLPHSKGTGYLIATNVPNLLPWSVKINLPSS